MNSRQFRVSGLSMVIMMVIVLLFVQWISNMDMENVYTYEQFEKAVENEEIVSAVIHQAAATPTGTVRLTLRDGTERQVNVPDTVEARELLRQDPGISISFTQVREENLFGSLGVSLLVAVVTVALMMMLLNRQNGGGGGKMMDFGRSRARMTTQEQIHTTFKDVAGLQEEKEDLKEIVDFLKLPQKYIQVGARIPKGVLLEGPPGTGKTLLAKAVAGEAGVPFFSISGSDFVEMFVGVGASRVRDLFADAKRNHPCIVFIDEIDAVARRRGTGMGGGHDEREQTLNQLLVEMDGFGVNEGIIVMAATNRVDILDPAILRPGRFDRKVAVGRPDAQTTAGMTGADLENLLNEAAIFAARDSRPYIMQEDIRKAFVKVGIGAEKKSRVVSEKEKRITAYHEAGHAILFHVLPDVGPVYSVSIIPTGIGAAGYTMPLPEKDEMFNTKGRMLQDIQVSLGGRIAEELVFDDITTGASQDIKQATRVARAMVTKYGMSDELGLVSYDSDEEVFIGRDFGHTKTYGEDVAGKIDAEIKRIVDECYEKAKKIILDNRKVLDAAAELLLEKEKISREELEALFDQPETA